ncbi:alpha/beta hydrolase [Oceanobacillus sp. CAU 1775]
MKNKKRWLKIVGGLLVFLLIIDIVAGVFFYKLAIERNTKEFLTGNADLEVSAEAMDVFTKGDWRTWVNEQDFEYWKQEAFDGITLQGYYLEAEEKTNRTVVFAHGYLGRAQDMALFGQHYYDELGFNMFTADSRGHGLSEGDYIGFGWHDRLDYVAWINRIIEELGEDVEIVLHGVSMGAATVLMTAGEELPDNVKLVVADSPYTSVHELFDYQLKRMFNLPSFPILPTTGMVTDINAGYNLKEASVVEQVKKAEIPILYIHGGNDSFVPTEMTEILYENTESEKDMHIVPGASHGESIVLDREGYLDTMHQFLDEHLGD